jgi:hypothetical protein
MDQLFRVGLYKDVNIILSHGFLKKIENGILKFQKILKKNPDVDNDMI